MKSLTKHLFFTGGGSAGHVLPNVAIITSIIKTDNAFNLQINYIGTKSGIEREIVSQYKSIKYHVICSDKLRRYFTFRNFIAPFLIFIGLIQSIYLCLKYKPLFIFSKGGYVGLPLILAGFLTKIPIIVHESDLTPGLANKISFRFAKHICISYLTTKKFFSKNSLNKIIFTGLPIRNEIVVAAANKEINSLAKLIDLQKIMDKKIILVCGGSLGSRFLNELIRNNIISLLKKYCIVHICGKNNVDKNLENLEFYFQFEYVGDAIIDLIKISEFVISRAGATFLFELVALHKPAILIPLSKGSRGDQKQNSKNFADNEYGLVIQESDANSEILLSSIDFMQKNLDKFISNIKNANASSNFINGTQNVLNLLSKYYSN